MRLVLRGLGVVLGALILLGVVMALWPRTGEAPGRMVDLGGRSLHLYCQGTSDGGPTVVFDSGAFGIYADWTWVQAEVAKETRACAFDRAGMGWSDPPPRPFGPNDHVDDLRALMEAAGEPGPYVLVGHSMAGLRLRAFSVRHRDVLAGLVFIDAAAPEALASADIQNLVRRFRQLSQAGLWAAQSGLLRAISGFVPDGFDLEGQALKDKRRFFAAPSHHRATISELEGALASGVDDLLATDGLADLPIAVFSAGEATTERGRAFRDRQAAVAQMGAWSYYENDEAASHTSLMNKTNAPRIAAAIADVRRRAP